MISPVSDDWFKQGCKKKAKITAELKKKKKCQEEEGYEKNWGEGGESKHFKLISQEMLHGPWCAILQYT